MSVKISLKTCKLKDAKFLMNIHNSAVKGGFFSSKNIVILKSHIKWLKSKLRSKSSKIYIGYKNKQKFGYVRFDEVKNNTFEVSIGNNPKFYGKGLGTIMLRAAIKKFVGYYKPKKITSIVKKNNIRSQRCFLKNDFKLVKFNKKKHAIVNKINTKKENYYDYKVII